VSDKLLHSINNQLAVVMGNAELLSLKVENRNTQETCREIQAAAFKINRLMFEYVGRKSVSSRTSDLIKINRAS
jgi:nitrogen-specific signal transduction histidine kinase